MTIESFNGTLSNINVEFVLLELLLFRSVRLRLRLNGVGPSVGIDGSIGGVCCVCCDIFDFKICSY